MTPAKRYALLERGGELFYILEQDGRQCIVHYQEGQERLLFDPKQLLTTQDRLLEFDLDPQGHFLSLKIKSSFRAYPESYLYELPGGPIIRHIKRCQQVLFLPDGSCLYTQSADLNETDLNADSSCDCLYHLTLSPDAEARLLLRREEGNGLSVALSSDREWFFVRARCDYAQNDAIYYGRLRPELQVQCLIDANDGLYHYLDSYQDRHYFIYKSHQASEQIQVFTGNTLISAESRREAFPAGDLPYTLMGRACCLQAPPYLLLFQGGSKIAGQTLYAGGSPLLLNLEAERLCSLDKLPWPQLAYPANLSAPVPTTCQQAFHFFCESLSDEPALLRLDPVSCRLEQLKFSPSAKQPFRQSYRPDKSCSYAFPQGKVLCLCPPRHGPAKQALLYIAVFASMSLLSTYERSNLRSPLAPWLAERAYAELLLSGPCWQNPQNFLDAIDESLSLIGTRFSLPREQIFLFESGFVFNYSANYLLQKQASLGGLIAYNLRTDLLGSDEPYGTVYTQQICGSVPDPAKLDPLRLLSQRESAEPLPPHLLLLTEDNLIVPPQHGLTYAAALQRQGTECQILHQDSLSAEEIVRAILTFASARPNPQTNRRKPNT